MALMLRLFAECRDDAAAGLLQGRLVAQLPAGISGTPSEYSRYWKMPELYEFTFQLNPENAETFEALIACVPDGWHHGGDETDRSSVWNRAAGLSLLLPEVTWAELLWHIPAP